MSYIRENEQFRTFQLVGILLVGLDKSLLPVEDIHAGQLVANKV